MEISIIKPKGIIIKGKNCTIAIDTFENNKIVGVSEKADCVLASEAFLEPANMNEQGENMMVFSWPGEFEIKGCSIVNRIQYPDGKEKKLTSTVSVDGYKICYLPVLEGEMHSDLIEDIGDVDILILPTDVDEKILNNTIEEIEPRSVLAVIREGEDTKKIMTATGISAEQVENVESFKMTSKSELAGDRMRLFLLKA